MAKHDSGIALNELLPVTKRLPIHPNILGTIGPGNTDFICRDGLLRHGRRTFARKSEARGASLHSIRVYLTSE